MDIKEKIKSLPNSSGVYIMKDEFGQVLYVGKAKDLRKRVSTYFHRGRPRSSQRIGLAIQKVEEISYIPTATEAEALIYENSLIKKLLPRYNAALRDDKSYPMLKLTINENHPRLFITRRRLQDGSIYYGPFTNAKLLRQALEILRQMFPLRTCGKMPKSVCLNYHIKQCLAPCAGGLRDEDYAQMVTELKLFLEGGKDELLDFLSKRMIEASREEAFEEASRLKSRIEALSSMKERAKGFKPEGSLEELKSILGIEGSLDVIEAFDVSNIMGKSAVGSMIYFYKGRPRKSQYRRFRIKTVSGIDDYAMMRELVNRRYSRLLREDKRMPDLIVIDGGKGHLQAALGELESKGISKIPAIGIAKPARRASVNDMAGGEFEHIYTKEAKEPIVLPKESKALHLLERIRDEAHRFAISYHKRLLSKGLAASQLDSVPGIGVVRKRALLNYFGTIDKIKEAKVEVLLKVRGINEGSARHIVEYFKK